MINQRQKKMLDLFEERGDVGRATLVKELNVSEATIRRDLHALEETGLLIRTLGGGKLLRNSSLVVQTFEKKRAEMREQKERIAQKAASLVKTGMVVGLDSGTTIWRIAAALKETIPLQILTSSLTPIEELGAVETISIYLAGGVFRPENLDFIGSHVVGAFSKLHADIAFIGADSFIPGKGVYCFDESSATVTNALACCADVKVLVVDHLKFDVKGCWQVLPSSQIDYIVTDSGINKSMLKRLKQESYQLLIAD